MSEKKDEIDLAASPDDFLTYRPNTVIALFDDPDSVQEAIGDLHERGISREDMHVLCGSEGAERLDVTGRHHGLRGRIYRLVEHVLGDEHQLLHEHSDHLARGGYGLAVGADEQSRYAVSDILGRHGGHDAAYFDELHWHPM